MLVQRSLSSVSRGSLFFTTMSTNKVNGKQRNLESFFKKAEKRPSSNDNSPVAKQSKIREPGIGNTNLSPEQKQRMEKNKAEASEKLRHQFLSGIDMGESWKNALGKEFDKEYFKKLQTFVAAERRRTTIYPPEKDVFSWTRYTHIKDIKVVIIGQDPYHGPRQAHGLCFSVQVGVKIPPSLANMYKELETDVNGFQKPDHGYLVGWAQQGVLLLNACLTVVASQANSHQGKGWETFTDATIKWINTNLNGVVFLLWGMYAQKKANFVDKKRHLVLSGKHPSPLSAHRGFFGCKHFSKTNEYLKGNGKKEIDWNDLPSKE